jgi:type IV pilus assembly protein PilX
MLILLVLTILGVAAMQMTRMQERMAGNSRDSSLAFQGSEAALRDAERRLNGYLVEPDKCTDPDAACTTLYARKVLPPLADKSADWWKNNAQEYGKANEAELTGSGLVEDPKFATEELAQIRNCLLLDSDCGRRTVYQVTARSTGGSGQANTVLQTTYAKPPY